MGLRRVSKFRPGPLPTGTLPVYLPGTWDLSSHTNESVTYQMKDLTEFFVILMLIMGTKVESSLDASFTNRVLKGDEFLLS
jgi:hypothetical protein